MQPQTTRYPYAIQRLISLYEKGSLTNVSKIDVEPGYRYVARISYKDDSRRIIYGNDLGLNIGTACDLAKDKGFAKFMLQQIKVECPDGQTYLLPSWAERIHKEELQQPHNGIQTIDKAYTYVQDHLKYPVYIKPVKGSKGLNIFKVYNEAELKTVFELYEDNKVHVALVEKPVELPDYRIVILDGQLISAYLRVPLTVTGDGRHNIGQLLALLQHHYQNAGRDTRIDLDDPRIIAHLMKRGLTLQNVPARSQQITLLPVSNLSAGGTSKDVTNTIHRNWVDLAAFVTSNFNLRFCGVDLACEDITNPDADYSVLEINAAPGLDHYAQSGAAQSKIVDELYAKVLNASG